MKRIFYTGIIALLFCTALLHVLVPPSTAAGVDAPLVVPRAYIGLARMLSDSKGDIDKACEIASKSVASVVEKGETYEEKLELLAEIATALTAAVADWSEEARTAVLSAIVEQALKLAPDGEEGGLQRIGYVKQVFAAIAYASSELVTLVSAVEVVPEPLKETAFTGIHSAVTVLGGKTAWRCKDLYEVVREALGETDSDRQLLRDVVIVTVTTTTTTTTSTTTTTIPGSAGVAGYPNRPVPTSGPVPTTRPSPTPVGLR